jgi:hypothetical protein
MPNPLVIWTSDRDCSVHHWGRVYLPISISMWFDTHLENITRTLRHLWLIYISSNSSLHCIWRYQRLHQSHCSPDHATLLSSYCNQIPPFLRSRLLRTHQIKWISTSNQLADIFPKPLVASKFVPLWQKLLGWWSLCYHSTERECY